MFNIVNNTIMTKITIFTKIAIVVTFLVIIVKKVFDEIR